MVSVWLRRSSIEGRGMSQRFAASLIRVIDSELEAEGTVVVPLISGGDGRRPALSMVAVVVQATAGSSSDTNAGFTLRLILGRGLGLRTLGMLVGCRSEVLLGPLFETLG